MKKFSFILLLFFGLLSLSSFSQGKEKDFTINGHINGLGNDSVIVYKKFNGKDNKPEVIVVMANNDRFTIKGKINSTKSTSINLGGLKSQKSFPFYLEPGIIKVSGQMDELSNVEITGTITNDENTVVRNFTDPIYKRAVEMREPLKNLSEESVEYKRISKSMEEKRDSVDAYKIEFVKKHPNSFLSASILYVRQNRLPIEELEALYNTLPKQVQESDMGITVGKTIAARKFVAVGNYAPDFTSKDTSGNPVKLSDFKGKYVLLEFWAQWCVPCRAEHPNLVALYEKYKDKGFTILQYSTDVLSAADKWKAAIVKDKLTWAQASELNGEEKISKMYGVQPIPDGFLIGPDGKILARGLRGKDLEDKLIEVLAQK